MGWIEEWRGGKVERWWRGMVEWSELRSGGLEALRSGVSGKVE